MWKELSSQAKPRGTLNLELAGAGVGVRREMENMALTGILCKYIEQTYLASLCIHLISIQTNSQPLILVVLMTSTPSLPPLTHINIAPGSFSTPG